jgi:primosomal protein N' (replication factor Y)
VLCDFGKRRVLGVVLDVGEREPDIPVDKIRPIRALVDPEPVLPEELLDFLLELARYYLAPIGEVMRLALPAVERSAARALGEHAKLEAVGRVVKVARATPAPMPPEISGQARSRHEHLLASGPTEIALLGARWGNARSAVKRLAEAGLVVVEDEARSRDPFFSLEIERDTPPVLTPPQDVAVRAIWDRLERHERRAFCSTVAGSGEDGGVPAGVQNTGAQGQRHRARAPSCPSSQRRPLSRAHRRAHRRDAAGSVTPIATRWKSLRSGEVRRRRRAICSVRAGQRSR